MRKEIPSRESRRRARKDSMSALVPPGEEEAGPSGRLEAVGEGGAEWWLSDASSRPAWLSPLGLASPLIFSQLLQIKELTPD